MTLLFLSGFAFAANANVRSLELKSGGLSQPVGFKKIDQKNYICVANRVSGSKSEIVVTKLDDTGLIIWSKNVVIKPNEMNKAYHFIIDRDTNIVIVGNVERICSFIMKVKSKDGSVDFVNGIANLSGSPSERFYRLYQMGTSYSDDYVVSGAIAYPQRHTVARVRKNGNLVWCKDYDVLVGHELMYAICEASGGDVFLAGHIRTSDYNHAVIRLDPSNGNVRRLKYYNISYNGLSNGGFDDAVPIEGTAYVALAVIINTGSGNPNYQGIALFNTKTNMLEKCQLYSLTGNARGISISYHAQSGKIIIGGAYVDAGNNNMFVQVIDTGDLKDCKTYKFSQVDYAAQSTGVAYIAAVNDNTMLVTAFKSNNSNLSVANLLVGEYKIENSTCLIPVNTGFVSPNVPASDSSYDYVNSTPVFSNYSASVSNNTYLVEVLCEDVCTPAKNFRLMTGHLSDTICTKKPHSLKIDIADNLNASPVNVRLYLKTKNGYALKDSSTDKDSVRFSLDVPDSIQSYRIIGRLKCSFNDTLDYTLRRHFISAELNRNDSVFCYNEVVQLSSIVTGTHLVPPILYVWTDSAGQTIGNAGSITFKAKASAAYFLTVSDNCSDPVTVKTRIWVAPEVTDSTIVKLKEGCSPFKTAFIHPKTYSAVNDRMPFAWIWSVNSQQLTLTNTTAGKTEPDIPHTFPDDGIYRLNCRMKLNNGKVCYDFVDTIKVYKTAQADFSVVPNVVIASDSPVLLLNKSLYADRYLWTVNDSAYTLVSPHYRFRQKGRYNIRLIAYTDKNCNDTVTGIINIYDEFRIFIPDAFTPGSDGINDSWQAYFSDFETIEIRVFNRWGEMVFMTNDSKQMWDGTYKGEPCPQENYLYIIKVTDFTSNSYEYHGLITLLR